MTELVARALAADVVKLGEALTKAERAAIRARETGTDMTPWALKRLVKARDKHRMAVRAQRICAEWDEKRTAK